jgi:NDP-sugar pyrophosphorylase family protein
MKTLLLAIRDGSELAPLTRDRCVALLPIAGKSLLVHTIESLAMAALTEVIIITRPPELAKVRKEIGNGARWGMRFDYILAPVSESLDDMVRRSEVPLTEELLWVCGDVLRTPIVSEFLTRARMDESPVTTATIGGVNAGLKFFRRGKLTSRMVPDESFGAVGSRIDAPALEFPEARLSQIESLSAFHRANIEAASGGFPGLVLTGRPLMPGVTVGRKTRLPARCVTGRTVFVGSRCRISASAELMDDVVVSDDVVIDRRVTLKSAVIMPNTYIGEFLEVNDAIVQGDTLIHIAAGGVTHVTDPLLLRNMLSGVFGKSGVGSPIDRASTVNDSTKSYSRAFAFRLGAARPLAAFVAWLKGRRVLTTGSDLATPETQVNDVRDVGFAREEADRVRNEQRGSTRQTIGAAPAGDEPKRTDTFVATAAREEFRRGEAVPIFRNGKGSAQSGKGTNTREAV